MADDTRAATRSTSADDLPRSTPRSTAGWHPPLLVDPQRIVSAALHAAPAQPNGGRLAPEQASARPDSANAPAQPALPAPPGGQQASAGEAAGTPLPGLVFIIGAVEKLQASREGRAAELRAALDAVMLVLRPRMQYPQANMGLGRQDAEAVIRALALACGPQSSAPTVVIALDCIEKLVSFRYFDAAANEADAEGRRALGQRLVAIVARCFRGDNNTADGVQLQIVKALFALLSSDHIPVRQAAMLDTIRTTYNVFVTARSLSTQTIAQGTLAQMVHQVLERVPVDLGYDFEAAGSRAGSPTTAQERPHQTDDGAARDAFLLIRSLCRLAMRPVTEPASDPKSPALRARCLALSLLRVALSEHTQVFSSAYVHLQPAAAERQAPPAPSADDEFGDAEGPDRAIAEQIADAEQGQRRAGDSSPAVPSAVPLAAVVRQYLSLALSRNLVSTNATVLELSLAVFELAMRHVRMYLRREAEVLFGEIVLPLLENKSSGSLYQRGRMLQTLTRMLTQPSLVVELYLNYDCSEDARTSVFQRLADVFCRLGGAHTAAPHKNSPHYALATAADPSVVAAAWRAVQQRQTVFNVPNRQVSHQRLDSPPRDDARRASRTQSMSSLVSNGGGGGGGGSSTGAARASAVMIHGAFSQSTGDGAGTMDEYAIRQQALDALSAMLQSMVSWSDRLADPQALGEATAARRSGDDDGSDGAGAMASSEGNAGGDGSGSDVLGPADSDDPQELFSIKHRKSLLEAGSRQFAWKAQKGIDAWRASGALTSNDPCDLARLLHAQHGLDKVQLGEYLGEGDAYNIAVMHAFVDRMDFGGLSFVAALRRLLQAFRLPGEAQKIDRFMLKFAERYMIGNPDAGFANADAAYVLAYSVILLNTDQHSPQVKHRMTKQEFISNNRGINDGRDLALQLLSDVFDQVASDEIKLQDDPLANRVQSSPGPAMFSLWGNSTANKIREQHAHASASMAAKSEQSIRSMARARRRQWARQHGETGGGGDGALGADDEDGIDGWGSIQLGAADYLHATRADHIAPMFGAIWTGVLAALSSPMQTSGDPYVVAVCLAGLQCGIALACRFRMSLERTTFVTTLRNFTQLQNLAEMRRKHVEAIRALVEVAASRPDIGDGLADSWMDVLQCVSQLERLQLLTQGSESAAARSRASRPSTDGASVFASVLSVSGPSSSEQSIPARTFFGPATAPAASGASPTSPSFASAASMPAAGVAVQGPSVSVAELAKLETNSQVLVVMVDRLFTSSVHLSGSGIVEFVRALSQVAWGEITASFHAIGGSSANGATAKQHRQQQQQQQRRHGRRASTSSHGAPSRLFSMTKIVEIAYYNMGRIRVEWSQIWAILGPLFDRVGAHSDTRAALFALDSLRQLSMKFLEKEELPHFAFQKEFLRPFADILEGYIPDGGPSDRGSASRQNVDVDVLVKDMVLRCVHQLVQAAAAHIRSGWKAILNVAQIAARDGHDPIAEMGFHLVRECAQRHGRHMWMLAAAAPTRAGQEHSDNAAAAVSVVGLEYFHELIACLSEYAVGAAVHRPRLALGAIDTLCHAADALGKQVVEHPAFAASSSDATALDEQPLYRVWMPVLRALYEVVMHTEDLEVRTRALDSFFRLAMTQGRRFSSALWTTMLRSLVFAMFADLRDPSASRRFTTVDDLELWFSTTLIKALRHLIALFSEYYPTHLSNEMMREVLELLVLCIAQPSEVLGKVGASCLHDMVRANYAKCDTEAWGLLCGTFARLFSWSQPRELFSIAGIEPESPAETKSPQTPVASDAAAGHRRPANPHAVSRPSPLRAGGSAESLLSSTDGSGASTVPHEATPGSSADDSAGDVIANGLPGVLLPRAKSSGAAEKPDYLHTTLKCILQLLLIQTVGELFGVNVETGSIGSVSKADDLYDHMSAHHLFILLDCLDQSRAFARRFNGNRRVRRRLVEMGVMPTMPSLLNQETGSMLMELHILQRMHLDAVGVGSVGASNSEAAAKRRSEREAVRDEVEDRLSGLVRLAFAHYCSSDERGSSNGKRRVALVSTSNALHPESPEARKQEATAYAWHPSVLCVLDYVPLLADAAGESFAATVARLWPDLVAALGVAVDVGDRDVVGAIQKTLAVAGTKLQITSTPYTI